MHAKLALVFLILLWTIGCSTTEHDEFSSDNEIVTILDSLETLSTYSDSALTLIEQLETDPYVESNEELHLRTLLVKAYIISSKNNFNDALKILDHALDLSEGVEDMSLVIRTYTLIGAAESRLSNFEKALESYFKGLEIAESSDHIPLQKAILHNIGMTYFKLGDYDNALKFGKKSIALVSLTGEDLEIGTTLNSIGNSYKKLNERDSAIYYYKLALEEFEKQGSQYALASIESNIGLYLAENKESEEAETYFLSALERMRSIGPNPNFQTVLTAYSGLLINTGRAQQALELLLEAEEMAVSSGSKAAQLNVYLKMAEAYKAIGQINTAYEYLDEAYDLNDSIYDDYLATAAKESEAKFEAEKKEQALVLKQVKLSQQKRYIWAGSIILFFMVMLAGLLTYIISRQRKLNAIVNKQRSELEKKAKKLEQKNEELNNLNTMKNKLFSVISHDIRTPIHSIRSTIELLKIQEKDETLEPELIEELEHSVTVSTDMIQKLLQWSKVQLKGFSAKPQLVNLFEMTNEALDPLENHADRKSIILNNWVDNDIFCYTDRDVIRVIIYNLTQNAIKFSHEGDTIEVSAKKEGNRVIISIEDNGVGMDPSTYKKLKSGGEFVTNYGTKNEKGAGLGLMLCREFIHMVSGSIDFESEQGKGTTFFINVPAYKSSSLTEAEEATKEISAE